jgi:hypothetical protein
LERAHLLGETTLSLDFTRLVYLSDANWQWRRYRNFVPGATGQPTSLRAITELLRHAEMPLYINFHPQQWFPTPASAIYFRTRNRIGRRVKPLLMRMLPREK